MKVAELINGEIIERDMTEEEETESLHNRATVITAPTQQDRFEAQLLYTALMTDTLLEE